MGLISTVHDSIEIVPPLKWGEYKHLVDGDTSCLLTIEEFVQHEDTDGGVVTRRYGIGIIPRRFDEVKAYGLKDELAGFAKAFGKTHTFTGWIVRAGEDHVIERYTIKDGAVLTEQAQMRWPDGTEVEL